MCVAVGIYTGICCYFSCSTCASCWRGCHGVDWAT